MSRPKSRRGTLIVEAVVAAFLMVFAFAASTSLFHAALQWESQGGNVRMAAMVAQRKVGEIRNWSESFHATNKFADGWNTIDGIQTPYPDAPDFEIEVLQDLPVYRINSPVTPIPPTPDPGMYSPTSHFFVQPPPVANPLPTPPKDFVNPQKNPFYATFSRVRTFPESYRRVQVVVRYGANNSREYRAVTLVGGPITRPTSAPAITITRTAGNATLALDDPADYEVSFQVNGHAVEDVVFLWGVDPTSTGAVAVKPKDSNGRSARAFRPLFGNPGQTKLAVRCRYRGKEYYQLSDTINVI